MFNLKECLKREINKFTLYPSLTPALLAGFIPPGFEPEENDAFLYYTDIMCFYQRIMNYPWVTMIYLCANKNLIDQVLYILENHCDERVSTHRMDICKQIIRLNDFMPEKILLLLYGDELSFVLREYVKSSKSRPYIPSLLKFSDERKVLLDIHTAIELSANIRCYGTLRVLLDYVEKMIFL